MVSSSTMVELIDQSLEEIREEIKRLEYARRILTGRDRP